MDIKADEITKIIREQIDDYRGGVDVSEVGNVISVGDGIARVYGLEKAMSGELLEFPHGVMGLALNLEESQVGVVLLGDYTEIREGDQVRRTGRIMEVPVGEALDRRPGRQDARRIRRDGLHHRRFGIRQRSRADAISCALRRLRDRRILPRLETARTVHLRRPLETRSGISRNLPAAPAPTGTRSLSRRRLLSPLATAGTRKIGRASCRERV